MSYSFHVINPILNNYKLVWSQWMDIVLVWRVYELGLHFIPSACILTLLKKYFLITSSFRNPRANPVTCILLTLTIQAELHALSGITLSTGEEYLGYHDWDGYFRCNVFWVTQLV